MTCEEMDITLPLGPFIVPLRADQIDDAWPDAEPLIRSAQRRIEGHVWMCDVYNDLVAGKSMLWLVMIENKIKAALITEVEEHPRKRVWRVAYVGGSNMSVWIHDAVCAMKKAARIAGCSAIEADGRLGWAKIAPRLGFKEVTRAYEMEID